MSCLSQLRLRVWDSRAKAAAEVPLQPSGDHAEIELRCLPGASGIQIALLDGNGMRLRAEVTAQSGEVVPIRVGVDEGGTPHVSSRGRDVLHLPPGSRYDPPAPILHASGGGGLDVAIAVDGTTRSWPQKGAAAVRLLECKDVWTAHVEKLADFVSRIAGGCDTRVAVLAFGDQDPPAVTARDLRPRYRLHPAEEERLFEAFSPEVLREQLLAIPPTPGADFVDATADALAACAQLHWRDAVRKLVVLSGDSPGASLSYPPPKGADLCIRQLDVDVAALELHARGVEAITIYHAPPGDSGLYDIAYQRDLLLHARDQYERLASLRELAVEEMSFEPELLADRFRGAQLIARGAALGEWLGVSAAAVANAEEKPARRAAKGR